MNMHIEKCKCGGKAETHFSGLERLADWGSGNTTWWVECAECGSRTKYSYSTPQEAVEVWNAKQTGVVNIEKLSGHRIVVLTGRDKHARLVGSLLVNNPATNILTYPSSSEYFEDYPETIDCLNDRLRESGVNPIVIITQSAEFLDCLLESKMDFILATVREGQDKQLRLRVLTKEEAISDRRKFSMELRK